MRATMPQNRRRKLQDYQTLREEIYRKGRMFYNESSGNESAERRNNFVGPAYYQQQMHWSKALCIDREHLPHELPMI
jgi:hypothetical protein